MEKDMVKAFNFAITVAPTKGTGKTITNSEGAWKFSLTRIFMKATTSMESLREMVNIFYLSKARSNELMGRYTTASG
jgi:hypothetical protein